MVKRVTLCKLQNKQMNTENSLSELCKEPVRGKNYKTVAISLTVILWFSLAACAGLPQGGSGFATEEACRASKTQGEWIKIDTPSW